MKSPPKVNPKIVGLILVLIFFISTAVVLTDKFSPRDRHPGTEPATIPSTIP